MHFGTKSYLKSTRNHTAKHALQGKDGWLDIFHYRFYELNHA
jgi:hypothetical protein